MTKILKAAPYPETHRRLVSQRRRRALGRNVELFYILNGATLLLTP